MHCPHCGHTMNHHADKLPLNEGDSEDVAASQMVEAYTCPHCGDNAGRIVNKE